MRPIEIQIDFNLHRDICSRMADFHNAIRRAVKLVGGQAKLAESVGCAQSEISRLCTTAVSVSPKVAIAISRATGGEVRIGDMMPEVVEAVAAELRLASEGAAA